jgi:hypothetical protein
VIEIRAIHEPRSAYLKDVLERLPTHPADPLGELLPDAWLADHPPGPTQARIVTALEGTLPALPCVLVFGRMHAHAEYWCGPLSGLSPAAGPPPRRTHFDRSILLIDLRG